MSKKLIAALLLVVICTLGVFSCKKSSKSNQDPSRNYFPMKFGKYIVYNVDSTYYSGANCTEYHIKSQLKYSITDSFSDADEKVWYLLDIQTRPYDGAFWTPVRVVYISTENQPLSTNIRLLYTQDNAQYIKMVFPVKEGFTWMGNMYVNTNVPNLAYLKDWTYKYINHNKSYNNGIVNFDNTVTVLENDENINYPNVDSGVDASRIYAKEVYAYNVGMIYKEWTHTTFNHLNTVGTIKCLDGYTVVMRAVEYN